jgi:hypothetical protein
MKDIARPRDMFLSHADGDEYIEQSTSQTLACRISSHRKAILNSVKKWATKAQSGSSGIIEWMRGEENNGAIDRTHTMKEHEKRGEKKNEEEEEERGDQTTDKQQLRALSDETTRTTTGNKSKDKTQDASYKSE